MKSFSWIEKPPKSPKSFAISTATVVQLLLLLHGTWTPVKCQECHALSFDDAECITKEEAINASIIHTVCQEAIPSGYIYNFLRSYDCLNDITGMLHNALVTAKATTPYCKDLLATYYCNYIYPSCDIMDTPIGICRENCVEYLLGQCQSEFEFFHNYGEFTGTYSFSLDCDHRLQFIVDSGLDLNLTMVESDQCVNITEIINTTVPLTTTTTPLPTPPTLPLEVIIIYIPVFIAVSIIVGSLLSVITIIYAKRRKSRNGLLDSSSMGPSIKMSHSGATAQNGHQEDDDDDMALFHLDEACLLENPSLQKCLIPFDQLIIQEEIGQGAFGYVFKGLLVQPLAGDGEEVAVKTIRNSTGSYMELKGFIEESMLMCYFDHPHVLGLVGICLDEKNSPYLLLPYMKHGDLKNFLKNKRKEAENLPENGHPEGLSSTVLVRMCSEIASGMEYLALNKLVHRDIAARNCMIDRDLKVLVADFGLTRDIYETDYYRQHRRARIPVKWMAPESLNDRISNQKTDVWSYGVTCWEVFSLGRTPYPAISNVDMLEYLEHGSRLRKPSLCPRAMYDLMKTCWEQQPEQRPTFAAISRKLTSTISPRLAPDDGDMIHDTVASDTTWDEDTTSNIGDLNISSKNDSNSLLSSIIRLLPNAYPCQHSVKVDVHSETVGTATPPEDGDCYMQMKKSVSAGNVHVIQRASGAYAYHPKATVGVARNVSNVSDYFLMFSAEPAKPKGR